MGLEGTLNGPVFPDRGPQFGFAAGQTVLAASDSTLLDLYLNGVAQNSRYLRVRIKNNGANALDSLDAELYVHPSGNKVTLADTAFNTPTVGFPVGRVIWSSGSNLHTTASGNILEIVFDITGLSRIKILGSCATADGTVDVEYGIS